MPKRSRSHSEATAAAVLDAALDARREHGYAAVRIDDAVAQAANVTRSAVYNHFKDKTGLFEAVSDRAQSVVGETVAAAADAVDEPGASFRAGCRAVLEASLNPFYRRTTFIDAPSVVSRDALASPRREERELSSTRRVE